MKGHVRVILVAILIHVGTLVFLGTKQNLYLNLSKRLIKVFESNQVTNDLFVVAINVRGQGAAISTTVFLSIQQKSILLILGK